MSSYYGTRVSAYVRGVDGQVNSSQNTTTVRLVPLLLPFRAQTHARTHARVFANGLVAWQLPPRLTEAGGNIAGACRWDGLTTGLTSARVVCESERHGGHIKKAGLDKAGVHYRAPATAAAKVQT